MMTIQEAMSARHMVRKYLDKPLPADVVEQLHARIRANNEKYGLGMKLVTNEDKAIWSFMKLFFARNVNNYLVLSAPDRPGVSETLGYCGIDVALYAQTLGLNSWWVGGTYSKRATGQAAMDSVVTGVIVLGYGAIQGVPHKSKTAVEVSSYEGETPQWFTAGVQAALLAPTAMNKQAFMIRGRDGKVTVTCSNGRYTETDLGIVKYHFEVGAGRENFTWE